MNKAESGHTHSTRNNPNLRNTTNRKKKAGPNIRENGKYCLPCGEWIQSYESSIFGRAVTPWEAEEAERRKLSESKVDNGRADMSEHHVHATHGLVEPHPHARNTGVHAAGSSVEPISKTPLHRRHGKAIADSLLSLFLISAGSAICGLVINGILVPKQFLSGGFLGLSLFIYYLLPSSLARFLTAGSIYFLFNIPIFIIGYKFVGRRFFVWSVVGMVLFSLATQFVSIGEFNISDRILAALFAGILMGLGNGLTLRSMGSVGGMDILAVAIFKKFGIRLGTTLLAFNAVILSLASLQFGLQEALYTLIYMFVSSQVINVVVTGLVSQRKTVTIISKHWREINRALMDDIHRGVTILEAKGGYTGEQRNVIYTVLTISELNDLKKIVHKIDPNAFIVVTDTMDVIGFRYEKQDEAN
ncbi:MAG: YitT family protein [Thermoplasmata archaeon]